MVETIEEATVAVRHNKEVLEEEDQIEAKELEASVQAATTHLEVPIEEETANGTNQKEPASLITEDHLAVADQKDLETDLKALQADTMIMQVSRQEHQELELAIEAAVILPQDDERLDQVEEEEASVEEDQVEEEEDKKIIRNSSSTKNHQHQC